MTRIIDADTLRITFDGNHEYVEKSDIDDAPEVEAIPVEYIRHWIHALNRVRSNGKFWAAMVLQALLDAWARAERREE